MYLTSRPFLCFTPPFLFSFPDSKICQNLMNFRISFHCAAAGEITMIFSLLLSYFKNFSFFFIVGAGNHIFCFFRAHLLLFYISSDSVRSFSLHNFINYSLLMLSTENNKKNRITPVPRLRLKDKHNSILQKAQYSIHGTYPLRISSMAMPGL